MRAPSPEYKPTLFDRHGPDAGLRLRAAGYSMMVFLLSASYGSWLPRIDLGLLGDALRCLPSSRLRFLAFSPIG